MLDKKGKRKSERMCDGEYIENQMKHIILDGHVLPIKSYRAHATSVKPGNLSVTQDDEDRN